MPVSHDSELTLNWPIVVLRAASNMGAKTATINRPPQGESLCRMRLTPPTPKQTRQPQSTIDPPSVSAPGKPKTWTLKRTNVLARACWASVSGETCKKTGAREQDIPDKVLCGRRRQVRRWQADRKDPLKSDGYKITHSNCVSTSQQPLLEHSLLQYINKGENTRCSKSTFIENFSYT